VAASAVEGKIVSYRPGMFGSATREREQRGTRRVK